MTLVELSWHFLAKFLLIIPLDHGWATPVCKHSLVQHASRACSKIWDLQSTKARIGAQRSRGASKLAVHINGSSVFFPQKSSAVHSKMAYHFVLSSRMRFLHIKLSMWPIVCLDSPDVYYFCLLVTWEHTIVHLCCGLLSGHETCPMLSAMLSITYILSTQAFCNTL